MRIVIDMTLAETSEQACLYAIKFAKDLVIKRADHQIILVLSDLYQNVVDSVRSAFEGILPKDNICIWCFPSCMAKEIYGEVKDISELIRVEFIASLNPDVVHVMELKDSTTDCFTHYAGVYDSKSHRLKLKELTGIDQAWNQEVEVAHPKNVRNKLTLAYVSPLPPERTGIADYSEELIPELKKYYDVVFITEQENIDSKYAESYNIHNSKWLLDNKDEVDRVLYQVGNSPFHQYMLDLVKLVPGTVVLHDFYLGHLRHWREVYVRPADWWTSLYYSHGYKALLDAKSDTDYAKFEYPVNWDLIKSANGLILHSEYSKLLLDKWYFSNGRVRSYVIPHLRKHDVNNEKSYRNNVGLNNHDFVICSFGFLGESKQNHRLIEAFSKSKLATNERCKLIFVGENPKSDYGLGLESRIKELDLSKRVRITGFAEHSVYKKYLTVSDVAVQLRTQSRGETSGTVLDCMNYGIPLIVNANGSMAELNKDAVWLLPDEFSDAELIHALEELYENEVRRKKMGEISKFVIKNQHSPEKCAELYFQAIESHHQNSAIGLPYIINKLAEVENSDQLPLFELSDCLARNFPRPQPAKRLFIDITATCSNDLKTGIERVARSLALELIKSPPKGYRVEPVYLSKIKDQWRYVYARKYTASLLELETDFLKDEVAEFVAGDVVLGLDISGASLINATASGYIDGLRANGTIVYYMVFDLLPVRLPEVFPPGADLGHDAWLEAVAKTDGIIAISKHVADDFVLWLQERGLHKERKRSFKLSYCHLGADINNSSPSKGLPENSQATLQQVQARPAFLMVGTIEPRKGYLEAINAFDELWQNGVDVNLVIVGKEGWQGLDSAMRRDIPETIKKLRNHPENGKRLFWLEGISDEYLEKMYANTSCLIAASYDEGFGLPLIEAAQHKLPIIARDIPVFREVAGEHAFYFDSMKPEGLADAIQQWLELYRLGKHPLSDNMPWLTWEQSAKNLQNIILESVVTNA